MNQKYKELANYLFENNYPSGTQCKDRDFLNKLYQETNFLDDYYQIHIPKSLRFYVVVNNIVEIPTCKHPNCSNKVTFSTKQYRKETPYNNLFQQHCSKQCASTNPLIQDKIKQTNQERYGSDSPFQNKEIKEKIENTNIERYGTPFGNATKEAITKKKQTVKERYGVENISQHEEVKKKKRVSFNNKTDEEKESYKKKKEQTCITIYGVPHPLQSEQVQEKIVSNNLQHYGVKNISQLPEVREKAKQTMKERYGKESYNQKHIPDEIFQILNNQERMEELHNQYEYAQPISEVLGLSPSTVLHWLHYHNIEIKHTGRSLVESEIYNFIVNNITDQVERSNRKVIAPLEADIVVKPYNLIIEYNGNYWHSEYFKDKKYHQNKSLKSLQNGYNIIHIWEDDWLDNNKKEIIKSKISYHCNQQQNRIGARQCTIQSITSKEARNFNMTYHIQGHKEASIYLGLFDKNNTLVACMSFKKMPNNVYDLNRFSTSCTVVGGFTKLLSCFKRNYSFDKIITFASLDYSNGSLYRNHGFTEAGITPPNYFYVDQYGQRYRREKFMKHKLPDKLHTFDPKLTEVQNMYNNNYYRIFDAGSIKFEYKQEESIK